MAMNSTEGLTGGAKPKYTFSIDLFRGVDYADNPWEMNEQRSPDMMNMISGENGSIKCRNGYEEILKLDGKINGIYTLALPEGDHILVHHGTSLSEMKEHTAYRYEVPEEEPYFWYYVDIDAGPRPTGQGRINYVCYFAHKRLTGDDEISLYVDPGEYSMVDRVEVNGENLAFVQNQKKGTKINMGAIEYTSHPDYGLKASDFGSDDTLTISFVIFTVAAQTPTDRTYFYTTVNKSSLNGQDESDLKFDYETGKLTVVASGDSYDTEISDSEKGTSVLIFASRFTTCEMVLSVNIKESELISSGYLGEVFVTNPYRDEDVIFYPVWYNMTGLIPEEGIDFKYYPYSDEAEWYRPELKKYFRQPANRLTVDQTMNMFGTGDRWFYQFKKQEMVFNFSGSVSYYFVYDGDAYIFQNSELKAGDTVIFEPEGKKLFINDVSVDYSKETYDKDKQDYGQEITMSEYVSSTIKQDAVLVDAKSFCQQINNKLCILDGSNALVYGEWDVYEGNVKTGSIYETRKMSDEAYSPVVTIGGTPIKTEKSGSTSPAVDSGGGGGTLYEPVNLLSAKRTEQFMVANESTSDIPLYGSGTWYYQLPLITSPVDYIIQVEKLNDVGEWETVDETEYTLNSSMGIVVFEHSLEVNPGSSVAATDNYRVTYVVSHAGTSEGINKLYDVSSSDVVDNDFYPPSLPHNDWTHGIDLLKFYIGSRIDNPDDVEVTLKTEQVIQGFPYSSYTNDEDDRGKFVNFNTIKFQPSTIASEYEVVMPNGEDCYIVLTKLNIASSNAVGRLKVYNQLLKEGTDYYLLVSVPYAYGVSDDNSKKRFQCYPLSTVSITARFNTLAYEDRINKAKISTKFGYGGNMDRLFVSGYDEMPEYEFWSEIDNPLYFPDLNYAACGDGDTRIMGWNRVGNNQLAIHKESNGQDPTVYIQRAELNEDYSVNFPVTEGAAGVGVISERSFAVLNGEPLALSEYGVFETRLVEDIPTDIKYAAPRSFYINPELRALDLSGAEAISFDNKYFLAVGGKVYIADGNQKYMIGGNEGYDFSYEWYPWDNIPIRVWWAYRGELYFGTNDGRICKFNDGFYDLDKPVECYWHSKPINFGQPAYYKKVKNMSVTLMPAEWCEVNIDYITGSMNKTVRTQSIHSDDNLPVTIPTNYKAKRIQDIQFKIWGRNAEPLEMINLTVLYTIGGRYKGM